MRISSISLLQNILLMLIVELTALRRHNILEDVHVRCLIATAVLKSALEEN